MTAWGFLYDQTRCIGCNACQMACKDGHDLEKGLFFRRVRTMEYEEDGRTVILHYSGACNHCEHPACVETCPAGAMFVREDGSVGQHANLCIGCGTCTWSCPYGAPKLSHTLGIARKCDSCYDRRQDGREPLCVEACLTHCLEFRDLDLLDEEEEKKLVRTLPILPEAEKTGPRLRIRRKEAIRV